MFDRKQNPADYLIRPDSATAQPVKSLQSCEQFWKESVLIIRKDVCRPLEVAEVRVGVIVKRAERKNFHVKIRGFLLFMC